MVIKTEKQTLNYRNYERQNESNYQPIYTFKPSLL